MWPYNRNAPFPFWKKNNDTISGYVPSDNPEVQDIANKKLKKEFTFKATPLIPTAAGVIGPRKVNAFAKKFDLIPKQQEEQKRPQPETANP